MKMATLWTLYRTVWPIARRTMNGASTATVAATAELGSLDAVKDNPWALGLILAIQIVDLMASKKVHDKADQIRDKTRQISGGLY